MTTASIRNLFAELRRELVPIVHAILDQAPADESCLHGTFPEPAQLDFSLAVARAFGYDLDRGRLDKTPHPFCTRLSGGDVRITTRVDETDIAQALFSILHETGHGMYEQGVSAALDGTRLGAGFQPACTRANPGCGRTWSGAAARSGSISIPRCKAAFPINLAA